VLKTKITMTDYTIQDLLRVSEQSHEDQHDCKTFLDSAVYSSTSSSSTEVSENDMNDHCDSLTLKEHEAISTETNQDSGRDEPFLPEFSSAMVRHSFNRSTEVFPQDDPLAEFMLKCSAVQSSTTPRRDNQTAPTSLPSVRSSTNSRSSTDSARSVTPPDLLDDPDSVALDSVPSLAVSITGRTVDISASVVEKAVEIQLVEEPSSSLGLQERCTSPQFRTFDLGGPPPSSIPSEFRKPAPRPLQDSVTWTPFVETMTSEYRIVKILPFSVLPPPEQSLSSAPVDPHTLPIRGPRSTKHESQTSTPKRSGRSSPRSDPSANRGSHNEGQTKTLLPSEDGGPCGADVALNEADGLPEGNVQLADDRKWYISFLRKLLTAESTNNVTGLENPKQSRLLQKIPLLLCKSVKEEQMKPVREEQMEPVSHQEQAPGADPVVSSLSAKVGHLPTNADNSASTASLPSPSSTRAVRKPAFSKPEGSPVVCSPIRSEMKCIDHKEAVVQSRTEALGGPINKPDSQSAASIMRSPRLTSPPFRLKDSDFGTVNSISSGIEPVPPPSKSPRCALRDGKSASLSSTPRAVGYSSLQPDTSIIQRCRSHPPGIPSSPIILAKRIEGLYSDTRFSCPGTPPVGANLPFDRVTRPLLKQCGKTHSCLHASRIFSDHVKTVIRRTGLQDEQRESTVERLKQELQAKLSANQETKPVKKVKWQACSHSGAYERKVVFDFQQRAEV
jgi:hypothetical protein